MLFKGKVPKKLFLIIIISLITSFILKNHLISKIEAYSLINQISIFSFVKIFILSCIIMYFKPQTKTIIALIPFYLGIFIFGDNRINMLVFTLLLYFSSFKKNGLNIPTILLMFYFSMQGLSFIKNIITIGNGFIIE